MSNRVLRKLQGDDDIKKLSQHSTEEQENKPLITHNRYFCNQFELVRSVYLKVHC